MQINTLYSQSMLRICMSYFPIFPSKPLLILSFPTQGLPPLKRPEMPTTPLQGAPLDLPPLKPAPRQPAFAGLNNAPGQRKLPPLGGPTSYDPSSLPSGDTRPSLPPLRGAIQPLPLGNLPQAGPSPPPASFSQQSGRQPSRKRIMHEVIDSQSSGKNCSLWQIK